MKKLFHVAAMALAVLLLPASTMLSAADAVDADAPLLNVSVRDADNGVMKTWDAGVSIKFGSKTEVLPGPPGAKALMFDGSAASVANFQLSNGAEKIQSAKDLSVTFSLCVKSESGDGDTGLGVKIQGRKIVLSGNGFNLAWKNAVEIGKWHQVAYVYSVESGYVKLYFDGKPDNFKTGVKLGALNVPFAAIGKFNGGLATIQAYPRALSKNELLRAPVEKGAFTKMREHLNGMQADMHLDQVKEFMTYGTDAIGKVLRGSTVPLATLQRAEKAATLAIRIGEQEPYLRDTIQAKTPFLLVQVQAISPILRNPDVFAKDAVIPSQLRVAAAKGEYEPLSFIIYPYKDIKDVTFTISDFKSDKGATLSSDIVDKKVVKYWYQESWSSNLNSTATVLVPGLLLNDEALVKVDEKAQKNYLRVGGKYVDISTPTESKFNYCKEDVSDAKELLPVNLEKGRGKQLWFTVHVPAGTQPGLYQATLTIKGAGAELLKQPVSLRVYPFDLPQAKTNYNHKRPYLSVVAGGADLARYEALTSESAAEMFFRNELKNLKAHGISNPAIPCPSNKNFKKDLKIRKDLGYDLKDSFIAAFPDNGTLMMSLTGGTAKVMDTQAFAEAMAKAEKDFEAIAGHKSCYFYGIEPATGDNASMVRNALLGKGCKALTFGWNMDEMIMLPTMDLMYAMPGKLDDYRVEKFHALQGRTITCGAQFAGVSNPDVLRRVLGFTAYHKNYDGFFLPAFPGDNCWNEFAAQGMYRPPVLAIPTKDGQINTLAYEGLREAIDDVRYISYLNDLLDEAYAKNVLIGKYAAKKGVGVFETQDRDNMDLDLVRIELADAITLTLMNLGKDVTK